ncbi:MAG: hypothetical protein JXJ22_03325 [Bacteroidales bacterium]|nr:hypothetical protein [Bacteroidales bacterium]
MKKTDKSVQKELFKRKLEEIVKLYSVSTTVALINDIVAIGIWTTPEKAKKVSKGSVAIDSVPLPEKSEKLRQLLDELIEVAKKQPLGLILKE